MMPPASCLLETLSQAAEGIKRVTVAATQIVEIGTVVVRLHRQIVEFQFFSQLLGLPIPFLRLLKPVEKSQHVCHVVIRLSCGWPVAEPFKDFSRCRVTFQGFGVIIQAGVDNAQVCHKSCAPGIISVFGKPFFGLRGDLYGFGVSCRVRECNDISNAAAGGQLVFMQPLQVLNRSFVIDQ